MLANLFGFVTAPIVFPIAYLLRNKSIVRNKILWIYFDDENEFGYDVDWWMGNKQRNFWTAYSYCGFRNPAWNLQALWILKGGSESYLFLRPKGILQKDSNIIHPSLVNNAVLKYVDADGMYMDNKGDFLSLKHSIIGSQFVKFYNIHDNKKYWKYTFANKFIDNIWLELQIGFTTRATFRLKIKHIKPSEII